MLGTITLRYSFLFILLNIAFAAIAQNTRPKPSLVIKKATGKITIDGKLNEPDWQTAEVAKDFFQNYPYDTSFAETKTEVRLTYNDKFLYIGAICYDELPGDYVIQSLKRDFSQSVNDNFAVFIDPFGDQTNGFSFAVSPVGAEGEGLIENGGSLGVSAAWDNRWFVKVTNYHDKWIVEMAIPFKTLRYKENIDVWRINFARNELKRNENSSWAPVPRNFNIASLAFTGNLIWDKPPKKAGLNISLIPYVTGNSYKDFLAGKPVKNSANAGLDAKVAVTSSLNLDITINSDFSQVEVDRQITNITRFNLFYPEKRTFFLENSDLFAAFGFQQIRPFYSRRIGFSGSEFMVEQVPILAGTRLSGNINKNWRIGVMSLQTGAISKLNLKSQNYSVAAVQRQVFERSNISAIFVNRQAFNDYNIDNADYNRIIGLDYNLASANDKWKGKFFYHRALTPQKLKNKDASASWLFYNSINVFAMWNHEYAGKNYIADVGFVPRNTTYNPNSGKYVRQTYWRFEPIFYYKFYPQSDLVNNHGPGIYTNIYLDKNRNATDYFIMPNYRINFQNTSVIQFHYHEVFTKLFYDTDVTFSGKETLIPAGNYYYKSGLIKYDSDKRKKIYGSAAINYGSYYNGFKYTYRTEINFRKQPWGIFSLSYSQDEIRLPEAYQNGYLTLIGSKIELSFTKNLYFTTFIQYNTKVNNININSRFQWRFNPVSDIYIVYTDNYDTNLGKKNRALVVKLIYWFTP